MPRRGDPELGDPVWTGARDGPTGGQLVAPREVPQPAAPTGRAARSEVRRDLRARLLTTLQRHPGLTAGQLATETWCNVPTVRTALDTLIAGGWVTALDGGEPRARRGPRTVALRYFAVPR